MEGDIKFGGYRASGGAYSMVMVVDARLMVLEQRAHRLALGTVGGWRLAAIESGRNGEKMRRRGYARQRIGWLARFWKSQFKILTT